MKKFYIKQKIFSFKDKYTIYNSHEEIEYYCKKAFIFDELSLYRSDDEKEIFSISRKIFSIPPKYYLYKNGREIAYIKKDFTFFKNNFSIESKYGDFTIKGTTFAHDFDIYMNGEKKAYIHKSFFTFGDCYEVIIDSDKKEDIDFFLALTLMIDNCIHNNRDN